MTSPDFSISDFLTWARTKPADEEYDYWCDKCAIGQFLVETGRAVAPTMGGKVYYDGGAAREIAAELNDAAYCEMYAPANTFGVFVSRLEALLPAKPISDTWVKADAYMADGLDELIEEFALLPVQA